MIICKHVELWMAQLRYYLLHPCFDWILQARRGRGEAAAADEHLLEEELEGLLLDGDAVALDEEVPGLAQYDLRVRRELAAGRRGLLQGDPPVHLEAGRAVEEPVE